ncbi:hypothetical protein, conserved [Plasmodium vivax]|uniref:Uncharacterized protein n=1 Tax=Plasmodium vivax (strain Salvador I) TaxID=126793 RepID=A5KAP9_PLAVS|nr:hypothetical protein, conserved [Plasmodium vivax]EDL43648.1 hypothetical protein, conserved [Plasmodium vivax]|eukprot:XP_001613375.1 hypothetical protein [Plasmodium vivax Sal-1]
MEKSVQDFLNAKGSVTQNGVPNTVLSTSQNGTPNVVLSTSQNGVPNASPSITQEQFNMLMCSIKRKDKNDQVQTAPQRETQHNVESYYPLDDDHGMYNHIGMNYIANKIVRRVDTPEKMHFPLYVQPDPKRTQLYEAKNNVIHHLQELLPLSSLQTDVKTKQLSKKNDHCYCTVGDNVGVNSRSDQGSHLMMHAKNKVEYVSPHADVQGMKTTQMGDAQSCFGQSSPNFGAAQLQDFHNALTLSHCNSQMGRGAKEEVRCGGANGDFLPSLRSFIVDGESKIDPVRGHTQGGSGIGSGVGSSMGSGVGGSMGSGVGSSMGSGMGIGARSCLGSGPRNGVERGLCADPRGEGAITNGIGGNPPSRLFNPQRKSANDYETPHREQNSLNEIKQEVLNTGTMRTGDLTSSRHLASPQGDFQKRDLLLEIQNASNNLSSDQTTIYRCDARMSNCKSVFPVQQGGNLFGRYSNYGRGRSDNVPIFGDEVEGASEMGHAHQQPTCANQLAIRANQLLPSSESHHPGGEVPASQKTTSCALHQSCEQMTHLNNLGKQINLQNAMSLLDDYISKMRLKRMMLSSRESPSSGVNISTERNAPAGTMQDECNQGYVNPNWSEQPLMHVHGHVQDKREANKSNHHNRVEVENVGRDLHRDDCPLADKKTSLPHDILATFGSATYGDLHKHAEQSKGEKCIGSLNVNSQRVGNCSTHVATRGGTHANQFDFHTSVNVTTKGNTLPQGNCTGTANAKFKPYEKEDPLATNPEVRSDKRNSSVVCTLDDKSKWMVSLYRRANNFNAVNVGSVGIPLTANERLMSTSRLGNPNDKAKLISGATTQGGNTSCSHAEDAGGMLLDEFNRIGTFSPEGYFLDSTQKRRGSSHLAREGNNYAHMAIAHHAADHPASLLNPSNKCKEGIAPLSLMLHQNEQHSICHKVHPPQGEEHHLRCTSDGPPPHNHHHHHSSGSQGLNTLMNSYANHTIGRMGEKALSFDAPTCNTDDSKEANLLNPIKKIMQALPKFQFDHHGGACNGAFWGDLLGLGRGAVGVAVDGPDASDGRNDGHYGGCYVDGCPDRYTANYPERYTADYPERYTADHPERYTADHPERCSDTLSTSAGDIPPGSKLGIITQNIRYYSNKVFNDVFMNNDAFKKKKMSELNLYLAKLRVKNYQEFFFNLSKFYEVFLLLLNSNYVFKFNSSIVYSICVVAKNLLVLLPLGGVYILHVVKTCLYCIVKLILIKPISITDKAWFFLLNLYKSLFEKLYQYFKSDLLGGGEGGHSPGERYGECSERQPGESYGENSLAILLPFINAFNETILEYAKIRIISRNKKKEELIAFPLYESLKPFFFVNTNYPDEADGLAKTAAGRAKGEAQVEGVPLEDAQEGSVNTPLGRPVGDGKAQSVNAARREYPQNMEANEDAPVEKHTHEHAKSATQVGPINRAREVDAHEGDYHSSEQQSGKVDSPVKFYNKKKGEDEELAVSIRNNILCCVHALIKMFSHIYINNWDKILYYYNENRKKLIPIFLTLTMNDQNQKIRTNSILCLKYLFDCKQLKYWFLLKEGAYAGAPIGGYVSGNATSHASFPPSYPPAKEIPSGSPTKKMIEVNRQNQNVPVKVDSYLPSSSTPYGNPPYSAGYANASFPDKQANKNIHVGKAHHSVLLLNDMNHSVKREVEIGANARSPLGSFDRDNKVQTFGEVRGVTPAGRSSNCGISIYRREYHYEGYPKEEPNEKGNYCSAKKAATEQNIVKLLTKFTKLITRTYMVDTESNFYTPTDRLNICRFFLRVSQSILIPKYKSLLRKILKFFFFYLLKYLIYFNHGDAFHFCIKRLLQSGTSKKKRQSERNIHLGYSLLPYVAEYAEGERVATHFSNANGVCNQTSSSIHLSGHRSEMLRMSQLSDNELYPNDYLDEDERVFSSLSNYLNSFRDTEESDAQGGEQPPDQRRDGEMWDGQRRDRRDRSGDALPGAEGDDQNCTGKGSPINDHRMTHVGQADQGESATQGDTDKKMKRKSKGDMKKGKEEKKHTDGSDEDGEAATQNESSRDSRGNIKRAEGLFEQVEEFPPSCAHTNEVEESGTCDRADTASREDTPQLKNPKRRKKKKKKNEERKDDGEDAEDSPEKHPNRSTCSCKHRNTIEGTKNKKKVVKKRSEEDISHLYKHIDHIKKKLLSSEDYDLLMSILYCNEYSRGSKYITMITVIINIFSVLLCDYNDEIFRFLCTNIYGVDINRTLNDHNIYCHQASNNQLYDISFAQLIYFMLIFLYKIFYQPCAEDLDAWGRKGDELVGSKGGGEEPDECQEEGQINMNKNRDQIDQIDQDYQNDQDDQSDREDPLRGHNPRADRPNAHLRAYRYEKKFATNSCSDLYDNYIISCMQQGSGEMGRASNLPNESSFKPNGAPNGLNVPSAPNVPHAPNFIPYDVQIFKNIFLVFQKTLKHYLFCYMHCWNDVKTLLEYFLQSENVNIKIISIKIVIDIFSFINSYYEVNCSAYELPTYRQKDEYKNESIFSNAASKGREWDNRRTEHTLLSQLTGREEELLPCGELYRKNRSDAGVFKTRFRHGEQRSPYGGVHSRIASVEAVRQASPHWGGSRAGDNSKRNFSIGNSSLGNPPVRDTSTRSTLPSGGSPTGSASKHAENHTQKRDDHHHMEATEMNKKKQFVQMVESDMIGLFRKYILIHIHNISKIHNDIINKRSKLKHIFLNTIICISQLSYEGFKMLTVEDIQRLTKLVSSCVHSIKCNIITALSKYIIKYIFTFNKKFIQNYEKRINLLHINSTNVYYNNILTTAAGVSGGFVPGGGGPTGQGGVGYAVRGGSQKSGSPKNGSQKNDPLKNDLQTNGPIKSPQSNAHIAANLPNVTPPNGVDTFERTFKTNMCTSTTISGVTPPQTNGTSTNMFIHSTPTNMSSERVSGRWKVGPVPIEEEEKTRKDDHPGNASPHDENYPHQGWHDKKELFEDVARVPTRSTMYNSEQVPNLSSSRRSSNSNTGRMAREMRQVGAHAECKMLMESSKGSVQQEHTADSTPYARDISTSAKIRLLNATAEQERTTKPHQKQWKENPLRCTSIPDATLKCSRGKPALEDNRMSNPGGSNTDQVAKTNTDKLPPSQKDEDDTDKERFPPSCLAKMATNTRNVNKEKMSKLGGLLKRHENCQGGMGSQEGSQMNRQISRQVNRHANEMNTQRNNRQVLLPPTWEAAGSKKNAEQVTTQSRTGGKYLRSSLHLHENDEGDDDPPSTGSLDTQRKDAYLLQKQRSERKLFELYYTYIYIIIHIIKFYNDSFVDLKYYTYNCICEIASSYVPFYFTQNNIKTFSYYSNYNSEENKDINKFISFINAIQLSSDADELKLFRLRGGGGTLSGDSLTGELAECSHHTYAGAAEGGFHKGVTYTTSSSNNTALSSSCAVGRGPPCRGLSINDGSTPPYGIPPHNAENLHDQFSNSIHLITYIEYIYILLLIIRENKSVEKDRAICCIIRYVGFICKNINFFLFNSISLLPSTFLLKYFMYLNNLIEKKGLLGGGLPRDGRGRSEGSSHGGANTGAAANEGDTPKGGEEVLARVKTSLSRGRSVSGRTPSSRSTDALVTVGAEVRPPACAHQGGNPEGKASSEAATCGEQKSSSEMKPTQKRNSKMTSTQKGKLYHLFLNVYVKYEYNFEDSFFSCSGGAAKGEESDGEKEVPTRVASSNEDPPQRSEPREVGRRRKKKGSASQEEKNTAQGEKPLGGQNTSSHDSQKEPNGELRNGEEPNDELLNGEPATHELLHPEHLFQGYSEKREQEVHADPIVIEIKDIFHSSRGKRSPINKANNNVDAKIILYLLSIVKDHIKNKITWNVLYAFKLIYNNFSFFLANNFAELHSQILDHLISTLRYTNVYKIKILSSLALIHIPLYYNIDRSKLKELWDTLLTNISHLDLIFVNDKPSTNQLLCYYDKGLNYITISKKTEYKYKCTLRVNICELLYMCIYRSYVHANINGDIEIENRRVNCYEAFKKYTHIFNINNDVHIYNLTHIFNNHVMYYSFYNSVLPPRKLPTGGGRVRGDSGHSMDLRTASVVRLRQDRPQLLSDRANQVGGTPPNHATPKKEEESSHQEIFELQLFLNNHFDKYHSVYKNLLGTGKNPIFQILFQKLHCEIKLSLKRFLEGRKFTGLKAPRGVSS